MDETQKELLSKPPPPWALKSRGRTAKPKEKAPTEYTYIEGWWVLQQMNAIFGSDGWSRAFVGDGLREVDKAEVTVEKRVRHDVAMLCEYQITIHDGPSVEDVGYGAGQSYHGWADAYESAAKEAVTDALKRCCRSLGNALGNCLYDKEWLKEHAQGATPPKNNNQPAPASGEEPVF